MAFLPKTLMRNLFQKLTALDAVITAFSDIHKIDTSLQSTTIPLLHTVFPGLGHSSFRLHVVQDDIVQDGEKR